MSRLKIVCAWCGKESGEKDGQGESGISHGICDNCLLYHFPHIYDRVKEILKKECDIKL